MRALPILVLVAATGAAFGQPLSCPPASTVSARGCEAYHFHVQTYRPETKGFVELYGTNQFASQAACDRARDAQMTRNLAVVDHMKRIVNDQQYQPDRFGTCHCDMTVEKTSPNFLADLQRTAQVRLGEEVRERVRERLLSSGLTTDSDLIRSLSPPPSANPLLGGPRMVPLPPGQAVSAVANATEELKPTKVVETGSAPIASLDLPLVEIHFAEVTAAAATTPAPAPMTPEPSSTPVPASAPAPAADSIPRTEENTESSEEAADAFISYETQRIQNVLKASAAINDEALKSKILESCMQRIQLLSNLRSLIQGSGARSRLATAARSARQEPERLALVAKLFGSDMPPHWAPKDATDVVFPSALAAGDPEKVLRDGTGKFSDQQKKHALYALLARSQPTEDQQLWLSTVVDTFLQ
jgi:hypothetical protein